LHGLALELTTLLDCHLEITINLLGTFFYRFVGGGLRAAIEHEKDEPAAKKREAENDQRYAQAVHLRGRKKRTLAPFRLSGHGKSRARPRPEKQDRRTTKFVEPCRVVDPEAAARKPLTPSAARG
jgi:hypothetical protein